MMWKIENKSNSYCPFVFVIITRNFLRPHKKGVKKIGLKGVKKENSCSAVGYYYLLVSRTTARFYSNDGTCFPLAHFFIKKKVEYKHSLPEGSYLK